MVHLDLEIKPPFFEIGPKAYMFGREVLDLARRADSLSREYEVQVIFTPQAVDIPLIAHQVDAVLVFAQHMDSLQPGRGTGSILPEAVKAAGAAGVLLNHVEKRLSREELARTIRRAVEVGLATMVCADDAEDAASVAALEPNVIIVEAPVLIAGGRRDDSGRLAIAAANEATWLLASSESEAMKTSSGIPPAAPAVSGPANVVLNALTILASGSQPASCSAADVSAGVWPIGLETSMTTLPATLSLISAATAASDA